MRNNTVNMTIAGQTWRRGTTHVKVNGKVVMSGGVNKYNLLLDAIEKGGVKDETIKISKITL